MQNKIIVAVFLCSLPWIIGCGRSNETQVIGSLSEDFLAELQAGQEEYVKQMPQVSTKR
ncbi:hypothetical protein [Stieleria marina]|uniref:Uncharacterized protein n=1 Tax=Stieleria marina TaxID=1930275 RepID=A0A517NZF9_9BACT|nr:hypothetical protein K239x_45080 [Planctomycetes bacterium K23_9]